MALTQYIGARYVPLFFTNPNDNSNNWKSGVAYDPLTIVTDLSQSYTSKCPVPASVGRPSENPDYWVLTGAYNAQIEQYRQEVEKVRNDIDDVQRDVTDIETEIHFPRKFLFVSDSYDIETNQGGKTFAQLAGDILGYPYTRVHRAGAGFTRDNVGVNFADVLAGVTEYRDTYTDIVVCGGVNDSASTVSDINAGMSEFMTLVASDFSNVKTVWVAQVSIMFTDTHHKLGVIQARNAWRQCGQFGMHYLANSEYIMHNRNLMKEDMVHPNSDGITELGTKLAAGIRSERCDAEYYVQVVGNAITGSDYTVEPGPGLYRYLHNDINMVASVGETIATVTFTNTRSTNNFNDDIFTVASPFIIGRGESSTTFPCRAIFTAPTGNFAAAGELYIKTTGELAFRCSIGTGVANISSVVIRNAGIGIFPTDLS